PLHDALPICSAHARAQALVHGRGARGLGPAARAAQRLAGAGHPVAGGGLGGATGWPAPSRSSRGSRIAAASSTSSPRWAAEKRSASAIQSAAWSALGRLRTSPAAAPALPLCRNSRARSRRRSGAGEGVSSRRITNSWLSSRDSQSVVLSLARSEEHTSELQSRENLVCR